MKLAVAGAGNRRKPRERWRREAGNKRTARFRKRALKKPEKLRGEGLLFVCEHVGRDFAEIPHEAAPGEGLERVVSDVDFPPEETLAGAGHVMVMIIVPAFAKGHQGQEPIVATGVCGFVAARTEKMRKRVDRESVMPEERCAQAETPEEERQASNEKKRDNENGWGHEIIFVEPAEFGKFGEVADVVDARADV